jgi:hypothetical protein
LRISATFVTGPTPPGTGVISRATGGDALEIDVADAASPSTTVVPTSITTSLHRT